MQKVKKTGLLIAMLSLIICVGCSLPQIFAVTSDVTSSLVYGSLIASELSGSQDGSSMLQIINNLKNLLSGES